MSSIFSRWQPRYAEHGIATFPIGQAKKPCITGWQKIGLKGSTELAAKFVSADALAYVTGQRSKPAPSGQPVPLRRRADAKYCTEKCAKAAENARSYQGSAQPKFRGDTREILQQNQGPKKFLIGPNDYPINVIGGYKFPLAPPCPDGVP